VQSLRRQRPLRTKAAEEPVQGLLKTQDETLRHWFLLLEQFRFIYVSDIKPRGKGIHEKMESKLDCCCAHGHQLLYKLGLGFRV